MGMQTKGIGGGGMGPQQDVVEAGAYPGRVVEIIDYGVQPQRAFQGQDKDPIQELGYTYELVDEFCKDEDDEDMLDKPRWIREEFPVHGYDMDLAKSTKRRVALDPKDEFEGDLSLLADIPVMIAVTVNEGNGKNKGKFYNNIGGLNAMRAKDAAKCAPLVNPVKVFMLDAPDLEVFGSLSKWTQERIKANLNYEGSLLETMLGGGVADDNDDDWEADD